MVMPGWDLPPVTTSPDGGFAFGGSNAPPFNPFRLSVSGPSLLARTIWVNWDQHSRPDVSIDVVRTEKPFSLDFYRQFARGTFGHPGAPHALMRWMAPPKFYVKTVDQNGQPIEPEVLAVILEAIPRAVSEFSAGKFTVAALETGAEARQPAVGWVNVDIKRDPYERSICGASYVGANPGTITFYSDVCSCGSNKIPGSLVVHEVGHAMGFFHVQDQASVMYPFDPGTCPAGNLSSAEKFHAGIVYSRPRGNMDPDNDPSSTNYQGPLVHTTR
jgi:hypothetical protein